MNRSWQDVGKQWAVFAEKLSGTAQRLASEVWQRVRHLLSRVVPSLRDGASDRQLRFLSQSARLEEGTPPKLVRGVALLSSLTLLGFLVWAGLTNINEVARTPGEVVPTGFVQTVEHLDGGTVRAINAAEGQIVQKGEVLLLLDGAGTSEDMAAARKKQWALEIRAERLRAFVNNRTPDFRKFGDPKDPVIAEQSDIFNTMMAAHAQQKRVIEDQISQKEKALSELSVRLETVAKNLKTMQKVHEGRQTLYNKALLPYTKLAETEKEVTSLGGEMQAIEMQTRQAQAAIQEFKARLESLGSTNRDGKFHELHQVASDLEQNRELINKLEARIARLSVKSPVRGIVKGLKVNTIGAVIQPGNTLMSIVPLDEALVVETRIPPHQIGHVSVGQPVKIKVSAYDFSRYGVVNGTVQSISATTFSDNAGSPYYRGKVALAKNFVGESAALHPVLPGMTVMAEIITGEKTVLDYLLKPIHSSFATAFSER
jgi:HlyD family secretion protein/adhesin transport system membrane fusion protein